MIVKIMGALDLIASVMILFNVVFPGKVMAYVASYLIGKGIIFGMTGDITSYIDAAVGIYVIFLSFGLASTFLTVLVTIYLLQKAIISFF